MKDDTYRRRVIYIPILIPVKAELDIFLNENREIKQTYFVSEAIEKAIQEFKIKKQLTGS